jgi:hypothetical protein
LYQLVETHLETFEPIYEERFAARYGRLRACVMPAFRHFLDCANPLQGFARLRCETCGAEVFAPFSCKSRCVCPSCEARKGIEWAEWVVEKLLEPLPHVQAVLSIPRLLRPYFLHDRSLLTDLARCAWRALKLYIEQSLQAPSGYQAGAVVCIQTFAENLRWNAHAHVLLLSGMVDQEGHFLPLVHWDLALLGEIFRREVLGLLQDKGLLSDERLALLRSWQHSGFHVHIGEPVDPRVNRPALEGLARYMVRAPVRHAQLLLDASAAAEESNDLEADDRQPTVRLRLQRPDVVTGETIQRLGAHELLARLSLHIPNPYQPLRFFYGAYSNHARHDRERSRTGGSQELDPRAPAEQPPAYRKGWRRRWAYLIQKIFGADPLVCRKCGGEMKVLALITEPKQVDAILVFLRRYHPERLPGASQDLSAAYQARAGPGLAAIPGESSR